jgi:hypothetical protein
VLPPGGMLLGEPLPDVQSKKEAKRSKKGSAKQKEQKGVGDEWHLLKRNQLKAV